MWTFSLADAIAKADRSADDDLDVEEIGVAGDGSVMLLAVSESGSTAWITYLSALTPKGEERWHRRIDQTTTAARPIAIGRDGKVAGLDGSLRAYALSDGHDLWRYAVSGAELGSPRVGGDGTIYVRGVRGHLHAVSPEGAERWSFDPE
jgi:outer membrane protein assembly factor BamB